MMGTVSLKNPFSAMQSFRQRIICEKSEYLPEEQSFNLGRPASDLGSRHQILFFPSLIFSVLSQCLFWRVSWRGREATVALSGVIKTDGRGSRGLCALWLESEADTVGPLIWRPGSPQQPVSFRAGTPQARKHAAVYGIAQSRTTTEAT